MAGRNVSGQDVHGRDDGDRPVDRVTLGLPAGGPCADLARATVVTLGRQAGIGRAALGALALAVDETLVLLLPATPDGVDLDSEVRPGALRVTVRARNPHTTLDDAAVTRFAEVAGDLLAGVEVDAGSCLVRLHVTASGEPTTAPA